MEGRREGGMKGGRGGRGTEGRKGGRKEGRGGDRKEGGCEGGMECGGDMAYNYTITVLECCSGDIDCISIATSE